MYRFKKMTAAGKIFALINLVLFIAFICIYVSDVKSALNMDPRSYKCISDSLTSQICHHPYSATISWSVFGLIAYWWPLLILWFIVFLVIVFQRPKKLSLKNKV